jgi:hypothetical protein
MSGRAPTAQSDAKTRTLRRVFGPLLLLPPLGFLGIAWLAPHDILEHAPSLARGTDQVRSLVAQVLPQFDLFRHARSTAFPQVATLASAYGIIWWAALILTLLCLLPIQLRAGRRMAASAASETKQALITMLAALPLGLAIPYVFFGLTGDPGFASGLTTNSRFGYGVIGLISITFSGLCLGMLPAIVSLSVNRIFRG